MRPSLRASLSWVAALALGGCLPAYDQAGLAEPDDGVVRDDQPTGDSDTGPTLYNGISVPTALRLDKRGVVYLTFDDGPSSRITPRILDVLAAHRAPAAFFLTGANIAGNEALVEREQAEGHLVCNHQWRHVIASSTQFRRWVADEDTTIEGLIGVPPVFFRYPYGSMKAWKEGVLHEEGYPEGGVGWDIDTLDWDFGPDATASRPEVPAALKQDFLGWIMKQVDAKGGGVILFHDVQSITADRLDAILTTLEARGLRYGRLTDGGARP